MSWLSRLFGQKKPMTEEERRSAQWSADAAAAEAKGRDVFLRFICEDRIAGLEVLIPKQLADGECDLALRNLGGGFGLIRNRFSLVRQYWAVGQTEKARAQMQAVLRDWAWLEREGGARDENPTRNLVALVACLLGEEGPTAKAAFEADEAGWMPSLDNFLTHAVLHADVVDAARWAELERAWFNKRGPKYMWAEYQFYIDALTRRWASGDALLAEHAKRWAARAKRNPDTSFEDGYGEDNIYIADALFGALLKRIGWEGDYRHAWPPCDAGAAAMTHREPDSFLTYSADISTVAVPAAVGVSSLDDDLAAIEGRLDVIYADMEGFGFDDTWSRDDLYRSPKDAEKAAKVLTKLSLKEPSLLALSQRYVLSELPGTRSHFTLCDPLGGWGDSMRAITDHYAVNHGLHADFVMLARSEEAPDIVAPEGQFPVLDRKSGEVLMADADEWSDAARVRKSAVMRWPNYASYVRWRLDGEPRY